MLAIIRELFSRLIYSVVLPTGVIVTSLYIFHSLGNLPLVISIVLAFAIGYFSMYLVFKYWISLDAGQETPQQQMMRYMIVFVVNVAINAEIVYFLVTYASVSILTAQAIAAVIVAYESYYAYRSLVFYQANRRTVAEDLATSAPSPEICQEIA